MTPSVSTDLSLGSSGVPSADAISGVTLDRLNILPSPAGSARSLPRDSTWYPTYLTINATDSTLAGSVNQHISGRIMNCAFPPSEALTYVRTHPKTINLKVGSDQPFAQAFQTATGLDPRNVGCKVEVLEPHTPKDLSPYIKDGDGISVQAYIPPPTSTAKPTYPPGYPSHLQSDGAQIHAGQGAILALLASSGITFLVAISTSL